MSVRNLRYVKMALVTNFLKLPVPTKHEVFLRIVSFPILKAVKTDEIPAITIPYQVLDEKHCNLSQCLSQIRNVDEDDLWGSLPFVENVITVVESYPDAYLPHKFKGIYISKYGKPIVQLDNSSVNNCERYIRFDYHHLQSELVSAMSSDPFRWKTG